MTVITKQIMTIVKIRKIQHNIGEYTKKYLLGGHNIYDLQNFIYFFNPQLRKENYEYWKLVLLVTEAHFFLEKNNYVFLQA